MSAGVSDCLQVMQYEYSKARRKQRVCFRSIEDDFCSNLDVLSNSSCSTDSGSVLTASTGSDDAFKDNISLCSSGSVQGTRTPLMASVLRSDYQLCCATLSSQPFCIDYQDEIGYTALMYAVRDGNEPIVRLLLENGADASLCTKEGYGPVLCASNNGFLSILSLLLQYTSINVRDEDYFTPMMCACQNNHAGCVRYLLNKQPDLRITNKNGDNAIAICLQHNSIDCLVMFLKSNIYMPCIFQGRELSVLYVAALLKCWTALSQLFPVLAYWEEFIDDLALFPNEQVEGVMIEATRVMSTRLSKQDKHALCTLILTHVSTYLNTLISVFQHAQPLSLSISSLTTTVLWCMHVLKIVSMNEQPVALEFFWSFVESVMEKLALQPENGWKSSKPMMMKKKSGECNNDERDIECHQNREIHSAPISTATAATTATTATIPIANKNNSKISTGEGFHQRLAEEHEEGISLLSFLQVKLLFCMLELYCFGVGMIVTGRCTSDFFITRRLASFIRNAKPTIQ